MRGTYRKEKSNKKNNIQETNLNSTILLVTWKKRKFKGHKRDEYMDFDNTLMVEMVRAEDCN